MKTVRFVLALLALSMFAPGQSAKAADVICYNCPPEWADWASMLKAIKADGEGFGTVVTHQVPIGTFDGPHPFFGPDGKLL
jgi:hypothetical protein